MPTPGALAAQYDDALKTIVRLRVALDRIGKMFYVSEYGAVVLKPEFGNYDVLEAANAELAEASLTDAQVKEALEIAKDEPCPDCEGEGCVECDGPRHRNAY